MKIEQFEREFCNIRLVGAARYPWGMSKPSLASTHPELAAEAHGWDPSAISPGSGKKLGWKCKYGHVWDAVVCNRTRKNYGCPICSNKQILPGFNDLGTKFPEIASQAHGWDPRVISPMSNKKLEWKCQYGHIWSAVVGNRTFKKYGCPICSNQQLLSGFNDLETRFPEIASQAHGWDPSKVAPFSNVSMEWKCKGGHIWKAKVTNRTSRGDGCSVCSSHQTLSGFNDLLTTDPELAKEAFGWDPTIVAPKSNKKMDWKCASGHTWKSTVSARTSGSGCPFCGNRAVLPGFNDLATKNENLSSEAIGWDPRAYSRSSNKKLSWKCSLGHIWTASIANRSKGSGCPICGGKQVLQGFNDLATKNPDLSREAFGWDPSMVTTGSSKRFSWKCPLGHIYVATVAARTSGNGCPYCSRQKVLAGFNDLATTNPELVDSVDGWDPSTVIAGTLRKLNWKCPLGHTWTGTGAGMVRAKGCPICLGQRLLKGFNDLATAFPEIANEAFEWDPTTVMPGTDKKLKWKCIEGHIWSAPVYHRTGRDKTGCPTCSKSGFDPNGDGWLYFLEHEDWEMFQIGITNVPDDRLARHKRLGWTVLELRGPMDGHLTQNWESSILRMLKSEKADLANEKIAGKFDGYSEAWSKSTFLVDSIQSLMRFTEEFEEDKELNKMKRKRSNNG